MAGFSARTAAAQPAGEESYPEGFKSRDTSNMQAAPRFDSYRDFNFVSFDRNIVPLVDYLGRRQRISRRHLRQTEAGMSIVAGSQEYSIRANWKLLTENSIDGYHALTPTRPISTS